MDKTRRSMVTTLTIVLAFVLAASACQATSTIDGEAIEQVAASGDVQGGVDDTSDSTDAGSNATPPAAEPADPDDDATTDTEDTSDADETSDADDSTDTEDTSDTDEDTASEDAPFIAVDPATVIPAPGETEVILLDPGSEPRQVLRLDLPAGCSEVMTIEQNLELEQEIDGVAGPTGPAVSMVMRMNMDSVRDGDTYTVTSTVVEAGAGEDASPLVKSQLDAALTPLLGIKIVETVDDRGLAIGEPQIDGLAALGDLGTTLEDLSSQGSNPLPLEAVGPGAQWIVITTLDSQGLLVRQVSTITIDDIDDTIVTTSATMTQTVEVGSIMSGPGFSAEVLEWDMQGSATTVADLQSLVPISSSATTNAVQVLEVSGFGGGTLRQNIDVGFETTGELGAGCDERTSRIRP